MGKNIVIEFGDKFGKLTVIRETEPHFYPSGKKRRSFECQCECGNTTTVLISRLRSGHTQSCGCVHSTVLANRNRLMSSHKETGVRLYRIWSGMKNRILNPNEPSFRHYGGRGITLCPEWMDYITFRDWALSNGYSDSLTIDRINNEQGYCPENCRWTTITVQARNKRTNTNLTAFGESKCLAEWVEDPKCKVQKVTLQARVKRYGWSVEDAISQPPRTR